MDIMTCKFCNVTNIDDTKLFTDEETSSLLNRIYIGQVTSKNLDYHTYTKIARHLSKGVYEGFGKDIFSTTWGTPDYNMLHSLRENVYIFSGAKTYQQTKDISKLLIKDNKLATFKEFESEAKLIFDKYNRTYLSAEYQSAIMQARSASFWMEIENQKHLYNNLEYHTVGDSKVRNEHQMMNGIVRNVDDRFWSIFMPPNGWMCRCTVLQREGGEESILSRYTKPSKQDVPEIFRFNAGKDKIIYSKKHPYFKVAQKDKEFAKNNFNLPLPK